ncbi:MAG: sulfotransferase [Sphingomonadaceae bacterium]|nr:sulfotransferase [Sphingomonadaceae bacterium]
MTTQSVEALHARASWLLQNGNVGETIEAHEALLAAAPDLADSWFNLAFLQRRAGQLEEALAGYQRALDLGVASPEEAHLNRGVIFANDLARNEAAESEFRAALAIRPDFARAAQNLGNVLEDRGDRAGAREAYERTLALEPGNAQALARFASLSDDVSSQGPILDRVRAAIAVAPSPLDRADLGFALGRALDAAGAYDEAFEAYRDANRANRESLAGGPAVYDPAASEEEINRLIRAFPASAPEPEAGLDGSQWPIFICGMFRSGSTLVERILSAHSQVTGGGELPLISRLVRNGPQPYPDAVGAAPPETIADLRAAYLEGLRALHPEGRVTDKRPDNFLHIGMIQRMFPEARIVNTVREPIDNCLSVWFLHLNPSVAYAHELATIAHWLGQYRRLMAHWRALYPDAILDMDYDALVTDPKPQIERLLDFCGLPWEDGVLAFHEAGGTVRTASAWQVRQPLYARSSGRWRNYERHLDGLRAALDAG